MDLNQLKLNELACAKGASSWLTSLPLAEEGYELHKDLFWDLIRLRYGFQLRRVPTKCECGSSFDLQHALSCKKRRICILETQRLKKFNCFVAQKCL